MTSTKNKKKPKGKPIKEKAVKKVGDIKQKIRDLEKNQDLTLKTPIDKVANYLSKVDIKELEALSHLAVNVRKLAKFQKQDHRDKLYLAGNKNTSIKLFELYSQLIDRLTSDCETFLNQTTKEKGEENKSR